MAIKNRQGSKREIDLTGPDGNAFVLLGQARAFAKQLRYTKEQQKALSEEMTKGDYEHLIQTFDKHFGAFVDLVR